MSRKPTRDLSRLALAGLGLFLVWAFAAPIKAQTVQTLCSFSLTNGGYPEAALRLGSDGNFYGTTYGGGISGYGTVFKVTTNGALTRLVAFNYANGAYPRAALTAGNDGNYYGTTHGGGAGYGTVFKVTTNGALTTLVSFNITNGSNPDAALTLGGDGNFHGTTSGGGAGGYGTVFKVTTNGTLTSLVSFAGTNGAYPRAGLTPGVDGSFYGTTESGGSGNYGTVFKVTTNGALTLLASFAGTNGSAPHAALTANSDGIFHGTTSGGGVSGFGTLFKVTTNGALTSLFSFAGSNGATPYAALTPGGDGNFYGTTSAGGSGTRGTVFQFTTNGALTTTFAFNNFNGAAPHAELTAGPGGLFYGTTREGGSSGYGTVFGWFLPTIIVQPQSQETNAGATVTFFLGAVSPVPLTYQWRKNGTNLVNGGNISGAGANTLVIAGVSAGDAATYSVAVSNANQGVTSFGATLTLIDPPVITAQPTNLLVLSGATATFGFSLTGVTPFHYQWQFNGTNQINATNAVFMISSVGTNDAGYYSVVITNVAGVAVSSNAALTVVLSPSSRTNYAGSTATFTAAVFGPGYFSYQWQKNGTNLTDGGGISGTTNGTLSIANVSGADAAGYRAIVSGASTGVTTANALLTVDNFPFIATQPQSQVVLIGSNVTFSTIAYGAPPLVFQWYFGSAPIGPPVVGTSFSSHTLTNVETNQSGNYRVQVVNGHGSATSSNATLVVALPPTILAHPANRTNIANTTALFSVVVSNAAPLGFQWQKNGTNLVNGGSISGATSSTLSIAGVFSNDAAIYAVTITNLAGSVRSSNATLTVIYPPTITAQPLSQQILLGDSVRFSVTVGGTTPVTYRWRLNGINLLNATNDAYEIASVTTSNNGNYSVVVSYSGGSLTSSNALLTVIVPPTLALNISAGYPFLSLDGMLGSNFVVQYNTNWKNASWSKLLSISNLSVTPYQFIDSAGTVPPARFYRAQMQ